MLKYIPYRISLNKVIIILNQANIYDKDTYIKAIMAYIKKKLKFVGIGAKIPSNCGKVDYTKEIKYFLYNNK